MRIPRIAVEDYVNTRALVTRRTFVGSAGAIVMAGAARAASAVTLDFAYYNPLSLVVRDQKLVEHALPGTSVTWVLSAGSNKALEYLRGGSIGIGSAAGAATLLARMNGAPVRIAGVFAQGEWTALVVRPGSPIKRVADLKGRTVAVTPGTDPFIFLLHALATAGLTHADVRIVPLQHSQGRLALDRGDVDAWAGLDPFMAEAELENHDVLFYRNPGFVSPGVLVVNETFLANSPAAVKGILSAYEAARTWAKANPGPLAGLLAQAARIPVPVAARQLSRTVFPPIAIGADQRDRISGASAILAGSGSLSAGADPARALASLYAPGLAPSLAPGPAPG
jgi:sulfonate transport system substrate-binding protein